MRTLASPWTPEQRDMLDRYYLARGGLRRCRDLARHLFTTLVAAGAL